GTQFWTRLAGGNRHLLGIKRDGSLWSWGGNGAEELGDGSNLDTLAPVHVGGRTNWVAIGGTGNMSAGLTADGRLWAWGIRLDQPPAIRVKKTKKFLGQLLKPFGVDLGPGEEKIYL